MKKLMAILIALSICAIFTPVVLGGDTDYINVTLTPNAEANITVDPASWSPSCGLGATEQMTNGYVNNTGTIYVSVSVNASGTTDWTLSNAAVGHDAFMLNITGGALNEHQFSGTASTVFNASLANSQSNQFSMTVAMPTSTSTNDTQSFHVTFVATVN
jgi:hypothetical protein